MDVGRDKLGGRVVLQHVPRERRDGTSPFPSELASAFSCVVGLVHDAQVRDGPVRVKACNGESKRDLMGAPCLPRWTAGTGLSGYFETASLLARVHTLPSIRDGDWYSASSDCILSVKLLPLGAVWSVGPLDPAAMQERKVVPETALYLECLWQLPRHGEASLKAPVP